MMQRFVGGDSNAVCDIVTGDASWIYCYDPETKRRSAQWVSPLEELPIKVKRGRSLGKKMVASFFGMTEFCAINAVEMRSLRTMYGVSQKNRCGNSDVRERCGLKEDVVTRVERGMFGHLDRMNESRLAQKSIERTRVVDRSVRVSLENPLQTNLVDTYKAGLVDSSAFRPTNSDPRAHIQKHLQLIKDASKQNVDILVFPLASLNHGTYAEEQRSQDFASPTPSSDDVPCDSHQYPEEISSISYATRDARMYVAINVPEKRYCNDKLEIFNSRVVFDRNGKIIKRYSEQPPGNTDCAVIESNRTFETDFGVTFALLSDSDLVYRQNYESLLKSDVENCILYADSAVYAEFALTNFPSTWAYVHKVNLLVSDTSDRVAGLTGVYATREVKTLDSGSHLLTMEIQKGAYKGNPTRIPSLRGFHGATSEHSVDLHSHSVEFLESALTNKGHRAVLCQTGFCCDFFLKTSGQHSGQLALAVFNGVRKIGTTALGLQACRVMSCHEVVDDNCMLRLPKESGLVFESVRISGNFSEQNSQQYPEIIMDVSSLDENQFIFDSVNDEGQRHTSISLTAARDVAQLGILSRDFPRDANDAENFKLNTTQNRKETFGENYLDKSQIVNFFDSLWITIRIPVFIVSIYVLEQI
ncbi:Vanin-like protein 2 [Eumeta japonica]|uniref:Vanin-like protein 2 n=1 Tax=Eumeta variegata TaxID=151549 RepID=A0A4C1Z512_EUMVA|nr:Vanin-like protein 2 [Eumeta japonica]